MVHSTHRNGDSGDDWYCFPNIKKIDEMRLDWILLDEDRLDQNQEIDRQPGRQAGRQPASQPSKQTG